VIISPSSSVVKKVPHQLWMYHYYLLPRRVLTFLLPTAAALRYPPSNHSSPVDFLEGARFEFPSAAIIHYHCQHISSGARTLPSGLVCVLPLFFYYFHHTATTAVLYVRFLCPFSTAASYPFFLPHPRPSILSPVPRLPLGLAAEERPRPSDHQYRKFPG
jgi:hypothetical protein